MEISFTPIKLNPADGWEQLLAETFHGAPVTFCHMTQRSIWTPSAQAYLGYRNALADYLRAKYPQHVIPEAPSTMFPTLRSKFNKEQKRFQYALFVNVFYAKDSGDASNGFKATEDAIQAARLLWNDKQVCLYGGQRFVDKEKPRVEFVLFKRIARDAYDAVIRDRD